MTTNNISNTLTTLATGIAISTLALVFAPHASQPSSTAESLLKGTTPVPCIGTNRSVIAGMANDDYKNPDFVLIYKQAGKAVQQSHVTANGMTAKVQEFCKTGFVPQ